MPDQDLSPEPRLGQRGREVERFGTLRLLPVALSAEARGRRMRTPSRSSTRGIPPWYEPD